MAKIHNIKMEMTALEGKYWASLEGCKDVLDMTEYLKNVYNFIKEISKYRTRDACFLVGSTFDEVALQFPLLEIFRLKYNLEKRMTFVEYKNRRVYTNLPHDHESISSNLLFILNYSPFAGTAFYLPTKDELIEIPPLKLGLAVGDPPSKLRYSCSLDVCPIELVGGNRPFVLRSDILHHAYEYEIGAPENYSRVVASWDSKTSFDQLKKRFCCVDRV